MPNVFGIADDILIAGFNKQVKDHDEILDKILLICRLENFKLKKVSVLRYTSITQFGEAIS